MRRMTTPMPHAPMMSGAAGDRVGTRRRGVQGTRLAQTRRDVHPSAHAPVPAEVTGAGVPQPRAGRGIEHHGAIDLKRQERIRMACRGQRTRGGPSTEIPRCGRGQPCGRHFAHALGRGRRQAWRADGCCPLTRRRSTWALLGVEDQASAWSALATGRGDHGAWVPSVHRAAPTSAARRPPTKIARIRSAPANSIQGGRVPTGKNRWDGEIVTGGVMLPLKTGAAGLASCPSCPLTITGGRDRRLPPSVLSSQPPRPPSLNSLWVQLTVATAPPVAAREPLGAVADPVWHSAVRTRVARRSMRRSHRSRSSPSVPRHTSPGRGSRDRCPRAPQAPAPAVHRGICSPAHAPAPSSDATPTTATTSPVRIDMLPFSPR